MADGVEDTPNIKPNKDKEILKSPSKEPPLKEQPKEKKKLKEPKLSVLETHGYTIGRSVGSGSYATVKVH